MPEIKQTPEEKKEPFIGFSSFIENTCECNTDVKDIYATLGELRWANMYVPFMRTELGKWDSANYKAIENEILT